MRVTYVLQNVFYVGCSAVGIEQSVDLLDKFTPTVTEFERFGVAVGDQHQGHVGVSRNIFPEFQQIAVDFGLLFGRIVGFLHTEVYEIRQVVEDVARQEDFRSRSQRFVQIQKLQSLIAQKCFRFAYNFHSFRVYFCYFRLSGRTAII